MMEQLISKYRTEIMGFAALWIGVLHAQMWFRFPLLQAYKLTGQGGVDLFLFLSGFGLYYAYAKGEHGWEFYKKRMRRILPFYIPAVLARCYYFHYDLYWSVLFASTISFWTGFDRSYWYVGALFVLYAIAPLYLKYFNNGKEKKMTMIAVIIALIVSVFFWHTTQLIFFVRVVNFFLGFYAGKRSYCKDPQIPHVMRWSVLAFGIGSILLYVAFHLDNGYENILYGYGMYWYPNILIIPALSLFLSYGFRWMDNHHLGGITTLFRWMGKASLSIYLLHDMCMKFFGARIHIPANLSYNGILLHTIILIITILMAIVYQRIIDFIMNKVTGA